MTKLLIIFLSVIVILFCIYQVNQKTTYESFNSEYLNKNIENMSSNKEGFVSNQCPTTMIKKGNQIYLYNPKLAKIPGVNPIVLNSLKDYEEYVKWQRASKINCPILHLERMYDTQGVEQYEIKQSFMLDQPSGPLNHDLPHINKTPNMNELLNAHQDNNNPYNNNSFPAFDPYNQNLGTMTKLDVGPNNPDINMTVV